MLSSLRCFFFFFNDTATTEIYTLSLHDALPIWIPHDGGPRREPAPPPGGEQVRRRAVPARRPRFVHDLVSHAVSRSAAASVRRPRLAGGSDRGRDRGPAPPGEGHPGPPPSAHSV